LLQKKEVHKRKFSPSAAAVFTVPAVKKKGRGNRRSDFLFMQVPNN